jgi:hypothetical protein
MIRPLLFTLTAALAGALFTGCAVSPDGPAYATYKETVPELAPDKGRVFFYRDTSYGFAITPKIHVNSVPVAKSQANGFFYRDFKPGKYAVDVWTEVHRNVTFDLHAAETLYVKFDISMGFVTAHVQPQLVPEETAKKEIATCFFADPKKDFDKDFAAVEPPAQPPPPKTE